MATASDIIVRVIDETRTGIEQIRQNLGRLRDQTDSINNSIRGLVAAYASLETGKAFLNQVEQVQQLDAKLKLVSKSQEDFNNNYQQVFEIAQRTRQPLNETGDLYAKIARSADQLGISSAEVAKVTETFNIALQRSGASGPAAAGAITQFAQALQSGKFQGDEFRSISEVIPEILDLISKRTGIAREDLKKYASDGLLTGKIAAIALLDSHGELELSTKTLSQAFIELKNQLQASVKSFLDSSGAGDVMIKALEFMTKNMDNLIVIAKVAGVALAGFAIYIAPVAAAVVAATVAVVAFADVLGPLLKPVVDAAEFAIGGLIKGIIGLVGAVKAAASLENPFEGFRKSIQEYEASTKTAKTSQENLGRSTNELSTAAGQNAAVTDRMRAAIAEANAKALEGRNSFDNFKSSLLASAEASAEDGKSKEYATLLYKAFEAKAKDLKVAVSALSDEQRKAIETEVGGLIQSKIANDEAYKAREKAYTDSVNLLKKYSEDYKKYNFDNLTLTETTALKLEEIETAYNTAILNEKKMTAEQRKKIEQDRADAISLITQKGITDLATQYKKYSDDSKSDAQKLADELEKIEEARRVAGLAGEGKYQIALEGLRDKAYSKYKSQIEDAANFALTREERLTKDLLKVDEEFRAVNAEMTAQHQAARAAVIFKANEEIYKSGQKYIEDTLSAEAIYNKRLMEIEAARSTTSTENQKYLNAALLALNKEYVDKVVQQYPLIYKEYENALMKMLGISDEKFGKLKEVFKLFGYDVDAILKDLFAQGIRYLLGFTNSANQNVTTVQGVFNQIFGSSGSATNSISQFASSGTGIFQNFISGATSLFNNFGSVISNIFSGIGNFIGNLFSGGGSILSTVTSAISTFAGGVSSTLGSIVSGVGTVVSTIGSAIGLTSAGAAAGGAAAGAAGGAAVGGAAMAAGSAVGAGAAAGGAAAGTGVLSTVGSAISSTASAIAGALGPVGIGVGLLYAAFKAMGSKDQISFEELAKKSHAIAAEKGQEMTAVAKIVDDLKSKYSLSSMQEKGGPNKFVVTDKATGKNILENRLLPRSLEYDKAFENYVFDLTRGAFNSPYTDFAGGPGQFYGSDRTNKILLYLASGSTKFGRKGLSFANGNLINSPTMFGIGTGFAVGGEMGTEAIMPLERTNDGRLGVSAEGVGGINITFNINAVDARGVDQLLMERQTLITNMVRKAVNSRGRTGVTL